MGRRRTAYRALVNPRRWTWGFISRADVADFLVKQIDDDAFLHKTLVLTGCRECRSRGPLLFVTLQAAPPILGCYSTASAAIACLQQVRTGSSAILNATLTH
jgi:hypothetical protein